ncbi:MAG TPA: adenylyl-sulfate kinase, partial [Solirubrobacteraceae bacterium]|nr:adenylyl-sulfate kinase [Solirubrobacteraceae bacterium]
NKMDLVDWSEDVFELIVEDFSSFAAKLDIGDLTFIPMSALHGDNVVEHSPNTPWYEGVPLLHHLEHVHIASDRNLIDPRLPVQWVIRPGTDAHHDFRGYAGQLAGGVWRPGDKVLVLPSGGESRVTSIETAEGPADEAFPPQAVTLQLEDELDVSRGDMLCRPHNRPMVSREIDAMVCWMSEGDAHEGDRFAIKHTTRSGHCVLAEVRHRVDVDTLHHDDAATGLTLNDIGRVVLRCSVPLVFDPYRRNRSTGSFILIDEATNNTVAAGMILDTAAQPALEPTGLGGKSANVVWQGESLTRAERQARTGMRGATIWFTGLPASGKSTIAGALERHLVELGRPAYRLDGDNLRHGLNGNLGFDPADRAENVRRTAHAARLLADAGVIVLVSLVSPYAADRALARRVHEEDELPFLEVFVNTPLELCERRDPKGLYARARRGDLSGMTGIGDPYEPPAQPELELVPDTPEQQLHTLHGLLVERRLLD